MRISKPPATDNRPPVLDATLPWRFPGDMSNSVVDSQGVAIAWIEERSPDYYYRDQAIAAGHLIAAAPELMACCQKALLALSWRKELTRSELELEAMLVTAIAKATFTEEP